MLIIGTKTDMASFLSTKPFLNLMIWDNSNHIRSVSGSQSNIQTYLRNSMLSQCSLKGLMNFVVRFELISRVTLRHWFHNKILTN